MNMGCDVMASALCIQNRRGAVLACDAVATPNSLYPDGEARWGIDSHTVILEPQKPCPVEG